MLTDVGVCWGSPGSCLWSPSLGSLAWPLVILVALSIDRLWGEPPARWHPVVAMGAYLSWAGRRVAPKSGEQAKHVAVVFAQGAAAWCLGAVTVVAFFGALVVSMVDAPWWLWVALQGICLKPLLAWRMLRDEVSEVELALAVSLPAGRARLSRLVSRDVARLDRSQVRESAIETLAENLNDSVVAPLFWFVVGGLPGAALYRFANTADAMWGYRGERQGRDWTWAGKWAARADDVLSWLPARLTGLLLGLQAAARAVLPLAAQARQTPSPNSGWPMAAMALVLGVRLGKPGIYTLNAQGRSPDAGDTRQAIQVASRAVQALVGLALAALLLPAIWRAWA